MTTETRSLDDILQRSQEANLDTELDLLREALMVAIPQMRDAGQNQRTLYELLLELERKKDGSSKGVLDPVPPDKRPRDFAAHLKIVMHHWLCKYIPFLARSWVKIVNWSQQIHKTRFVFNEFVKGWHFIFF